MSVQLDHTIISATDKDASARFLADVLTLPAPETFGRFTTVRTGNDVTLDFQDACGEVVSNHYAFLVSETEFDAIFQRLRERDAAYWADPHHERPGSINTRDGGRGLYFEDPDGHNLEILTRPYGSGS